jgi:hypothetical protein
MGFISFRHPAVAARWGGRCISFLVAFLVQVTAPAPQAAGRLLAICPDVAKLLVVMVLRKTILISICLYADCNVAEVCQSENFLGFCRLRQGYQENGEVYDFLSFGR